MNHLQKRRISLAIIIILHILLFTFLFNTIEKSHASGYINGQKIVTGVNYFSPRIQQICNDSYIGYEYNHRLEKRCRVLWNSWTNEILQSQRLMDKRDKIF